MKTSVGLLAAALCLCCGCGCGNRSLQGDDGDAGTDAGLQDGGLRDGSGDGQRGDGPRGDGSVPHTCDAQDARPAGVCGLFLGYAWNGDDCVAINCSCEGADCDALYETYGACLGDYAACLPPTGCDDLGPMECEATAACRLIWYGGGCINTSDCTFGCSGGAECICYERGYACVPADPACIDRSQAECNGSCFWEAHSAQICFETCCIDEGWGYCRGREAPASCATQQIDYCSDPCLSVAGVWWNGDFCQPIVCCCDGPDCNQTWSTWQACLDAHRECALNACATTGGYCDYGDAVIPTCLEGYGKDFRVADGTCGLGVCCAPCPVDGAAGVDYVSHDPTECARLDFDCGVGYVGFDNECGCGCLKP